MRKMKEDKNERFEHGRKKIKSFENYQFVSILSKILQPVFNILFYISVFFVLLLMILSLILLFVNMPVDEMLLPPFMHKADVYLQEEAYSEASSDTAAEVAEGYVITLGNGVKIATLAENVTLGNIKTVLYAEITVLVFALLTVAPILKFLAALLNNINKKIYFDLKNARYIMFIGLCVSVGTMLIRFMSQFYNYYLLNQFITDASQEISLHLRIDALSGLTGLAIILIGFIFAHSCGAVALHTHSNTDSATDNANDTTTDIVIK